MTDITAEQVAAAGIVLAPGQNPDGSFKEVAPVGTTATPSAPATVPDFVPEKFRTAADPVKAMADAYAALEAKLGAPKAPDTATEEPPAGLTIEEPKAPAEAPGTVEEAAKVVSEAGLDFAALTNEVRTSGELSEASYKALADKGIPKAMADGFIAGQKALAVAQETEILSVLEGGRDTFATMATWAASADSGMTKAQIGAINAALSSGDVGAAQVALSGLAARYAAAEGSAPGLLKGGKQPTTQSQGDVFANIHEQAAAQGDPRYGKDITFTRAVEAKIARSNGY
jgi:hypothetical protein